MTTAQARPRAVVQGLRARLSRSRPPTRQWLLGGLLWGGAMVLAVLFTLAMDDRLPHAHLSILVAIYFGGGLIAWLVALPAARFLCLGRPVEVRLAGALLLLTLSSAAATAFLFAIQYRLFYAQWHEPAGTVIWAFQFVFTSASAVYQFAVLGLRLLMPLGFVALLGASVVVARLIR